MHRPTGGARAPVRAPVSSEEAVSSRLARLGVVLAFAVLAAACGMVPEPPEDALTAPTPPAVAESTRAGGEVWTPAPGTTWQWQLSVPFDPSVEAQVYDLDLFDTEPETIERLHARGARVICYLSAGSWEDWRPDAGEFPPEVIGRAYTGWAGERWLDVRQIERLAPILKARLELCRDKGFDAVEPDNIDGYQANTGFPLTADDQRAFNRWLAEQSHALGLSIGLKNDPDQAAELVADFDWALTEDCYDQGWCSAMQPFLEAGKAVFVAEYTDTGVDFGDACRELLPAGFSPILKDRDLTPWRETCP